MRLAFPSLVRLVRQQVTYIVVAVVLGAVFWAIGLPINPWTVLLYTLCIGNLLSFGSIRWNSFFQEGHFHSTG